MQWFNPLHILTSVTLVSALAIPSQNIEKRDAAQTVKDIQAISASVDALTAKVNTLQNGLQSTITSFSILSDSTNLNNQIKQATKNAQASQPYTDDGSFDIAGAVFDLQPKVTSTIDALIAKKPVFKFVLFGGGIPIVKSTLQQLRGSTSDLGKAVTAKLSADLQPIAPTVLKEIDDDFARGIKAFSSFSK